MLVDPLLSQVPAPLHYRALEHDIDPKAALTLNTSRNCFGFHRLYATLGRGFRVSGAVFTGLFLLDVLKRVLYRQIM